MNVEQNDKKQEDVKARDDASVIDWSFYRKYLLFIFYLALFTKGEASRIWHLIRAVCI